eukprot:m.356048 g.356048  ORF g.356048 m.356048 type:complete len:292 (-) comp17426_c0_seq1:1563-2438(-)
MAAEPRSKRASVSELTPNTTSNSVSIGRYQMQVWSDGYDGPACFCAACLRGFDAQNLLFAHLCLMTEPPGHPVYSTANVQVRQVEGSNYPRFCCDLVTLGTAFIPCKLPSIPVTDFVFYTLYDCDSGELCGFTSKELEATQNHILSCLVILPAHQRRGYGRLLARLMYLEARAKQSLGTPERPYSVYAEKMFQKLWQDMVLEAIAFFHASYTTRVTLTVGRISQYTGMLVHDVVSALESLDALKQDSKGVACIAISREMHMRGFKQLGFTADVLKKCISFPCAQECTVDVQ